MKSQIQANRIPALAVGGLLGLLFPAAAKANFLWPPALYFAGATIWWAIPAGLAAEILILTPFLFREFDRIVPIMVVANLVSAVLGFVLTWPLVYWDVGIELMVNLRAFGILLTFMITIAINILIEYWVLSRWYAIARGKVLAVGLMLANIASFLILVTAAQLNLEV